MLTRELDLLCTAEVVVLATNLIKLSGRKKEERAVAGGKKGCQKMVAKTPHKGAIRGNQLVSKGGPHSQLRVITCSGMSTANAHPQRLARKTNEKRKKGSRSVALFFL
jgi:hypothetical protein